MSGLEDAFITALEGELGIPSLENIYNKDILKFHMKIQLMDEDRIPKRIYEMQWPTKTRKFSLSNIVKSLSRKWRIPLEKDEIAQTIAAKTNTDPNTINGFQIKKHWKLIVDKHMASYTRKRVRKDRTRDNFHYKQFQPEIKHAKPYTTSKSKGDHLCRYSGKAEPRIMPSLQTWRCDLAETHNHKLRCDLQFESEASEMSKNPIKKFQQNTAKSVFHKNIQQSTADWHFRISAYRRRMPRSSSRKEQRE